MQETEKIKEEQRSKYFSIGIVVIGDVFIDIKGYLSLLIFHREEMWERLHRFMAV